MIANKLTDGEKKHRKQMKNMILPINAFNWAALRSGLSTGDFIASLTPEREEELFNAYNAWRRSKGLAEEKALTPIAVQAAVSTQKPEVRVDPLSALFSQVAEEVVAEEAALVQDALDGADGIVEEELEAHAPFPAEVEEEADEPVPEEAEAAQPASEEVEVEIETDEPVAADDAPKAATAPAVANEAELVVDFAAVIRSLPKEADPELYRGIKAQFGEETLTLAQTALKKATAKHRTTAAIRAFIAWLERERS